jgi:hypothetical protein
VTNVVSLAATVDPYAIYCLVKIVDVEASAAFCVAILNVASDAV